VAHQGQFAEKGAYGVDRIKHALDVLNRLTDEYQMFDIEQTSFTSLDIFSAS